LGTILPGITRASVMTIARDLGMTVEEAPYSFTQWREDAASGRLKEAFACGTAAVLASIGEVRFNGGSFLVGSGEGGPVTAKLKQHLVGIQRGTKPDTHGWLHAVD
jgi:branched-chain amino acid aminotransferase